MISLPAILLDLPDWALGALIIAALLLMAALIQTFTKLTQHLGAFSDALRSHATLNQKLNEELARAIEQRQALQAQYDALDTAHRKLKADFSGAESRIVALEYDRGALKDDLDALKAEQAARDAQHQEVVAALTAQITALKGDLDAERQKRLGLEKALEAEKQERERTVGEMRAEIDRLTKANAKLVKENQELQRQITDLRARANHVDSALEKPKDSEAPETPAEEKEG